MDWKKIGKKIISLGAPLLGTALGGPGGTAIGAVVASVFGASPDDPQAVYEAIKDDPKAAVKAMEIQTKHKETLEIIQLEHAKIETAERMSALSEVNATMRAESKSEHWPQYSWRPWNGFLFAPAVIAIYFFLPLFDKAVPGVPEWVWMGWLAVLGVATWDRGKAKRAKAGEQKAPGMIASTITAIRKN